jgi:hypothetical protein
MFDANAQELKVYTAGATKEVVIRIAPEFTRATDIKVVPVYDTVEADALAEAGFSVESLPLKSP